MRKNVRRRHGAFAMRENYKDGKVSMVLSQVVKSLIGLPVFCYVGNVYILGLGLEKEEEPETAGTWLEGAWIWSGRFHVMCQKIAL